MKKSIKITIVICIVIITCLLVACRPQEQKKTYTYGVISFREIKGETVCFVYVPARYCGDVGIYLNDDYITYPKEMKEGDLVKLTFSGSMQIRESGSNKFFGTSPELIEILGSNAKIQEKGENYELSFPLKKVENLTENSAIIDIYKGELLVYSINNFSKTNENIVANIYKEDIFKVLENYSQTFKAR